MEDLSRDLNGTPERYHPAIRKRADAVEKMTRNSHLQPAPTAAATEADIAVLRRLAAGDREAVAELYDRHAARVMGLAYRIVRNSSDAEDVVQEVFSQAWRTAPNYQAARGTVAGWLLMMARTRAIDRLRTRQTRRDLGGEPDLEAVPSDTTSLPDQIIANQRAAQVRAAILTLPADQKTALELAYFEGLTQTEIAERLRIPLGTVKTRIRSALASLRRSVQS